MLMSPELSQWWALVITSPEVSLRGGVFQYELRRAVANGERLTAEQEAVVDEASLRLGERPS